MQCNAAESRRGEVNPLTDEHRAVNTTNDPFNLREDVTLLRLDLIYFPKKS